MFSSRLQIWPLKKYPWLCDVPRTIMVGVHTVRAKHVPRKRAREGEEKEERKEEEKEKERKKKKMLVLKKL